jgi:hypothetical protein
MARSNVVKIKCDRCERVEERADESKRVGPQLHAVFKDDEGGTENIVIEDLCTPCLALVRKNLEAIGRKIEKASPARGAA